MYKVSLIKLTSCSGCISEVVYAFTYSDITNNYGIVYSTELTDSGEMGEVDIALIEGSVSDEQQEKLVKSVRAKAKFVAAIGTCAIMGGIQSMRADSDIDIVKGAVYPEPQYVDVYGVPKPITDVINVDFALPGCPINGDALVQLLRKYALGGLPVVIHEVVCATCKRKGLECVTVSKGVPCLGPITISGCGAICPSFGRGCYGCFGIKHSDLNKEKLEAFSNRLVELGAGREDLEVSIKGFGYKTYSMLTKAAKDGRR
jgi:coenzyme F420-reducing hydrogenase gamma subunit